VEHGDRIALPTLTKVSVSKAMTRLRTVPLYIISILYTMPICDHRKYGRPCPSQPFMAWTWFTVGKPNKGRTAERILGENTPLLSPWLDTQDSRHCHPVRRHRVTTCRLKPPPKWRLADHHYADSQTELQVIPKIPQTTPKGLTSHACVYTPAHIRLTLAHMRFAPAHTPALAHCSRYNLSGIRVLSTLFQLTFRLLPRAGRGAWGGTPLHSCKNHTMESRCVIFW